MPFEIVFNIFYLILKTTVLLIPILSIQLSINVIEYTSKVATLQFVVVHPVL